MIEFSVVVLGELHFGFRRGARLRRNEEEFRQFLRNPCVELLPVGPVTFDRHFEEVDGLAWTLPGAGS